MTYKKSIYSEYVKRTLDFMVALIGIVLLLPVLLVLSIIIRINLGAPVFFTQERPGKNERIFKLIKFRSMLNSTDDNGKLLPDTERMTSFGNALRATSLDELPELINILRGDMSIVGPRPLDVKYLPYYTEEERIRHSVRPGLTGLAQINGRNTAAWEERFRYDIQYVESITFINDIKILFKTVKKVACKDDIGVAGIDRPESFHIYRQKQWESNKDK